jgi:hypothetical protein
MFTSIENHIESFLRSADASLHAGANAFLLFFKAEENKVAQEVADLKAKGLKVLDAAGKEL